MRLEYSPECVNDLLDIATYIARDNPTRALSFVDELEDACARLRTHPGIGTARPELGANIRVLPHGRYLIFRSTKADLVRIERVLHGARDVTALFGDDDNAAAF